VSASWKRQILEVLPLLSELQLGKRDFSSIERVVMLVQNTHMNTSGVGL
jgi:hypothetical protein